MTITQFEVGETYAARSLGDYDCIFVFTVISRTAHVRDAAHQQRRGAAPRACGSPRTIPAPSGATRSGATPSRRCSSPADTSCPRRPPHHDQDHPSTLRAPGRHRSGHRALAAAAPDRRATCWPSPVAAGSAPAPARSAFPCGAGFSVLVTLEADDTYTVRRVFVRRGEWFLHGERSNVYCDEVSEVVLLRLVLSVATSPASGSIKVDLSGRRVPVARAVRLWRSRRSPVRRTNVIDGGLSGRVDCEP